MQTGFRKLPTEETFARRSARYLHTNGYRPAAIKTALVDELGVTARSATRILASLGV
jgi:hypothetical protein